MTNKVQTGGLAALLLIVFAACNKQDLQLNQAKQPLKVDESKIQYRPTTQSEIQLVENLGKLTDVLKMVYSDRSNLIVVNAAIYAKVYTDESILIKDLIYPEQSRLTNSKRFNMAITKHNVSLRTFASAFWKAVAIKNDPAFKTFLEKLKSSDVSLNATLAARIYNDGNYEVSIYFPYHEEFIDENFGASPSIVSLTTATADADEGIGEIPVYDTYGNITRYEQVLVNDAYAEANPTHIIGLNGVEPYDHNSTTDSTTPPPPPPNVNRIYIGEGICKVQYDKLISFTLNGGGSEIMYNRISGYLKPVDGHITSFEDITQVDFSRRDIRKQTWKRTMHVWDDDWEIGDKEQVLAIFEEDTEGTKSFTGSLKTTLDTFGIPVEASIGFTISIKTKDPIIKQLMTSRHSYFAGAFVDQGQGFTKDRTFIPFNRHDLRWPAYDVHYDLKTGANVGWTWPYNKF